MYSINYLPMNVLITSDEVLRFFPGNSMDPNLLSSVIFKAEQRFAVPILGAAMYADMCTQKNVMITAGNIATYQTFFTPRNITLKAGDIVNAVDIMTTPAYATLWNATLWPFLAECIIFSAMPANYAKFTTQGIVKNNPSPTFIDGSAAGTSSGISLNDLKYLRDNNLLQDISVLTETLETFLITNKANYPLLPQCLIDKYCGSKPDTRKSGLVFIYDDEDDEFKRNRRGRQWD